MGGSEEISDAEQVSVDITGASFPSLPGGGDCARGVGTLIPFKLIPFTLQVHKVLRTLIEREGLQKLPVFALGASSGGAFVLMLAGVMPLAGICVQVWGPHLCIWVV